jgi:hypothetical protein
VVGPHARCSLVTLETRVLVSKPHLLSFDSDSDSDPDPDYKTTGVRYPSPLWLTSLFAENLSVTGNPFIKLPVPLGKKEP